MTENKSSRVYLIRASSQKHMLRSKKKKKKMGMHARSARSNLGPKTHAPVENTFRINERATTKIKFLPLFCICKKRKTERVYEISNSIRFSIQPSPPLDDKRKQIDPFVRTQNPSISNECRKFSTIQFFGDKIDSNKSSSSSSSC